MHKTSVGGVSGSYLPDGHDDVPSGMLLAGFFRSPERFAPSMMPESRWVGKGDKCVVCVCVCALRSENVERASA